MFLKSFKSEYWIYIIFFCSFFPTHNSHASYSLWKFWPLRVCVCTICCILLVLPLCVWIWYLTSCYWKHIRNISLEKIDSSSLGSHQFYKALHREVGACEAFPSVLVCQLVFSLSKSYFELKKKFTVPTFVLVPALQLCSAHPQQITYFCSDTEVQD